jgi:hypothetical protein
MPCWRNDRLLKRTFGDLFRVSIPATGFAILDSRNNSLMSDNTPVAQAPTSNLIPVFVGCICGVEQHVCNARDLHLQAFLGIWKDFTAWIKDRNVRDSGM